ncbi:MAG: hypothetical protein AAF998_22595 [Bacteroidota bacterium]
MKNEDVPPHGGQEQPKKPKQKRRAGQMGEITERATDRPAVNSVVTLVLDEKYIPKHTKVEVRVDGSTICRRKKLDSIVSIKMVFRVDFAVNSTSVADISDSWMNGDGACQAIEHYCNHKYTLSLNRDRAGGKKDSGLVAILQFTEPIRLQDNLALDGLVINDELELDRPHRRDRTSSKV